MFNLLSFLLLLLKLLGGANHTVMASQAVVQNEVAGPPPIAYVQTLDALIAIDAPKTVPWEPTQSEFGPCLASAVKETVVINCDFADVNDVELDDPMRVYMPPDMDHGSVDLVVIRRAAATQKELWNVVDHATLPVVLFGCDEQGHCLVIQAEIQTNDQVE